MKQSLDVGQHEHVEHLLEEYIFGMLDAPDHAWMDDHVRTCRQCKQDVGRLLLTAQALPSGQGANGHMNHVIWDQGAVATAAIGPDPADPDSQSPVPLSFDQPGPVYPPLRPPGFSSPQWWFIAVMILIGLLGGLLLAQVLPPLRGTMLPARSIVISSMSPDNSATGELTYLPDQHVFIFEVTRLPLIPAGHVYQAWLIDSERTVSAGTMTPGDNQLASVGDRGEFETYAITVEPGPSGNGKPTTEPIMVAPLHNDGAS